MNSGLEKDALFHFKVSDVNECKKTSIDALFFSVAGKTTDVGDITICVLKKSVTRTDKCNRDHEATHCIVNGIDMSTYSPSYGYDNFTNKERVNEEGQPYTDNMEVVGVARLHPNDYNRYSTLTGIKIALGHAIKKSIPSDERYLREIIWNQFFKVAQNKFGPIAVR